MKKETGIGLVNLIIIGIILLIVVGVCIYFVSTSKKNELTENYMPDAQNTQETNITENKYVNSINNDDDSSSEEENKNIVSFKSIKLDHDLELSYNENGAFLMSVEDVYTWAGHGTMVEGTVLRGKVKAEDTIQIIGMSEKVMTTTIVRVEKERKEISQGKFGDKVTVLLKDFHRNDIDRGQVLAQENSILASNKIQAKVEMYNGEKIEKLKNIKNLKCYIRDVEIAATVVFNDETDENVAEIHLETPIAVEKGMEFTLKNEENSIAKCTITNID